MRRFLAYIVMMLTVISTLVFNTQTIFESTTDAMEYGKSTQLTFSLTQREDNDYSISNYPNLNPSIQKLDEIDIESKIMTRLDDLGVRNAEVELVKGITSGEKEGEGYKINVTFSPLSDTELNNVKQVLSYDGSLSMATVGDDHVYYQDRNELFDDPVAKLVYNGTTPYPSICIKSTTMMDQLITECKNAATAHKDDVKTEDSKSANRKYASDEDADSSDSSDSQETKIYLWQNKTEEDTYNKAYGYGGERVDEEVARKVIAVLDTSNYSSENKMIALTSDKDGNAFTVSSARAMVSMLNSEDYGFDIHYLYSNAIYAGFGSNAFKKTYIGFGVALLVIAVLLIALYGFSGITSSINLLASLFISVILFNLLGFEFSIAGIAGLCVVAVFSIFLSANYFQHVKNELKKGRDIEKANREGYRKSFFVGLDTALVLFLGSLFGFLVSLGSFKTFFGAVMVGVLFSWIITTFLNKWATYWLCKDVKDDNRPYFSFKKNSSDYPDKKKEFVKAGKKGRIPLYVSAVIAALTLGISLPMNYALGKGENSFFNNSGSYAHSYQLSIEFATYNNSYSKLESSETYLAYLNKLGEEDGSFAIVSDSSKDTEGKIVYKANTAFVNVVEKYDDDGIKYYVNYFNVHTLQNLNDIKSLKDSNKTALEALEDGMLDTGRNVEVSNEIINPINDGNYKADSFVAYSQETSPINLGHDINNLFLVLFLLACFVSVYAFVRFGLNMFLTIIASGTAFASLSIGVLALSHLSFNPYVSFAVLALNLVFDFLIVPLFHENKTIIKEHGLKGKATEEERKDILNSLIQRNKVMIFVPVLSSLVLFVPFVFVDSSLLSMTVLGVILAILAVVLLYSFALPFYLLCTSHISFRRFSDWFNNRKEKRNDKKAQEMDEKKKEATLAENPNEFAPDGTRYVDPEGPHETIIVGMNEFRH